jgi:hypothetical protein
MNGAIFWNRVLCSPYESRRFGGTYHLAYGSHLLHAGFLLSRFSTLQMVIRSFEKSLHIWTTRCYIPEDGNKLKLYSSFRVRNVSHPHNIKIVFKTELNCSRFLSCVPAYVGACSRVPISALTTIHWYSTTKTLETCLHFSRPLIVQCCGYFLCSTRRNGEIYTHVYVC